MVKIYTDGAAKGNPGPGGYGIIMRYGDHEAEFSAGYRLTTNNRMELLAVVSALEKLKRHPLNIQIISDSKYVIDAVSKGWVFTWEKNGFKKKKNPDLWQRFLRLYRMHNIQFTWIRGHNGHPENERCDALAVAASEGADLLIDTNYEQSETGLFD